MNGDPIPPADAAAPGLEQLPADDAAAWAKLGRARDIAGDLNGAAQAYAQALAHDAGSYNTGLRLGHALERLGRSREAVLAYFRALRTAQSRGRWLNAATTPVELREFVEYAIGYVSRGQHDWFDAAIAPLRVRYGRDELRRVEHCLRVYLGFERAEPADARQKPTFLYFPGLPAQPFPERALFPALAGFESQTAAIRDELLRVLPQDRGREAVFHRDELTHAYLRGSGARWDGYYFYRHGERRDDCCAQCPQTAAALDTLPLVRVPGHAPEVLFSVFAADTHLLPHRGVTNTRLVVHLPLIVPPDCALTVGGEVHVWREGRAVVFDDTYEHEAWNRSGQTRVVLIADIWHPQLSEAEREALSALVVAIGDFHAAAGERPVWHA